MVALGEALVAEINFRAWKKKNKVIYRRLKSSVWEEVLKTFIETLLSIAGIIHLYIIPLNVKSN